MSSMNDEAPHLAPMNRSAVISIIAALLTVLSFCIAVAPIPLTGYVCYPAAALTGLVALITGLLSLAQISQSAENGRPYALIGITVGTLSVIASACAIALGIALFPRFWAFLLEGARLAGAVAKNVAQFFGSLWQDIVHFWPF